jgi:hypothetical protein
VRTAARPFRALRHSVHGLPASVASMLGLDEPALAVLPGFHESGLVLTTHRVLGWRVNGVTPGLRILDLERIVWARGERDLLAVIARPESQSPLVVMTHPHEREAASALIDSIAAAVVERSVSRGSPVAIERTDADETSTVRFVCAPQSRCTTSGSQ